MEAILGVIVGFVAFGIVWYFLLKPKKDEVPTDELKIKEEATSPRKPDIKINIPNPSGVGFLDSLDL